ncbi:MAG: SAM-dependent methyltransferase, partial [Planctomycetota bacterium]|nr:SAM-dependent methyltransferase [Planctomycetota bacterium]
RAFRDAGVAERVEVRRTTALEAITALKKEFGAASFDLLFADAIKSEYPAYFRAARELIRPGGLFIADNALGGGSWWVDEPGESPESHEGAVTLNRLVAADPDFDSTIITNREGLLVARRRKN